MYPAWCSRVPLAAVLAAAVACGGRTGLTESAHRASVPTPDGGSIAICGPLPRASIAGFSNANLCSAMSSCDDIGGAHVCPCAGAAPTGVCGFDAIHDDGHIFTAQCELATGACQCVIDGVSCGCQGATKPVGLCVLDGPLNCCFP